MNKNSTKNYEIVQSEVALFQNEKTAVFNPAMPEIDIIVKGSGTHTVMGQELPCSEGDIFIVNAGTLHSFGTADGLFVQMLMFEPSVWLDSIHSEINTENFCYGVFSENDSVAYARLTPEARHGIERYNKNISEELKLKRREWQCVISANLSLMLITVGRYITDAIKNIPADCYKEWRLIASVMHSVTNRYMEDSLTLSKIAAALYVSESQLSRSFKQLTGQGFSAYLKQVRIDNARRMLEQTDMSIEAIMENCGLRDLPSFYRSFAQITGNTPAKYRTEKQINKGELKMQIISEISQNLQKGKTKIVKELVQNAIDAGANVEEILNDGLLHGMNIIGEKFKNGEVYVPEVLIAARAMEAGTQILKPLLVENGVQASGKVCIGTVQGDMHDIGKNLVRMMMEGKGLEVIDLGTDVAPETFIQTAIDENCQIICCSALLTTTMDAMKTVVDKAKEAGIRDKVKIMIGGAPVNQDFCDKIGADCYTQDAASAANAAVEFCK